MRWKLVLPALLATAGTGAASGALHGRPGGRSLVRRAEDFTEACTDLTISENKGDRKVAIVIDSSGSMADSDPSDLRLVAGRALNSFLISADEAGGGQKPDQVTVIDFDSSALVVYPLGDPNNEANASFALIDSAGGTYIADGVRTAMDELTKTGNTDKRSAIVVFTDGSDTSTTELVNAINNATALGIRVSFGFLSRSAGQQDRRVQAAIRASRGVYATITLAAGSQNYINYVILNGLTYNDNPQGFDTQLLAGLAETHVISGSETVNLRYAATSGENVTFRVTAISSGPLSSVASMDGRTLDEVKSSSSGILSVVAPKTGTMDVRVTANRAAQDSLFSVLTNSNVPIKNCTVGVRPRGLSTGAKAGIGVGVSAAVLGLGALGGYFLWKHFHPPTGGEMGASVGGANGAGVGGGHGASVGFGDPNTASFYPSGAEKPLVNPNTFPSPPPVNGSAPAGYFAVPPPLVPPGSNNNQPDSNNNQPGSNGDQPGDGGPAHNLPPMQNPGPQQQFPLSPDHTGSLQSYNNPTQPGFNNSNVGGPHQYNPTQPGFNNSNFGGPHQYNPTQPGYNNPNVGGPHQYNPTQPGYNNPNVGGPHQYNPTQPGFNNSNFGGPHQYNPMPGQDFYNPSQSGYPGGPDMDHHDPDNCSCHTGPSDNEADDAPSDGNPAGPSTNPGQTPPYVPNPTPPQPGKHKHKHHRRPKLKRSRVEKHHHHDWTGPKVECRDQNCVLARNDHRCTDPKACPCTCRDDDCEVTKRRLAERRMADAASMAVGNVPFVGSMVR